MRYIEPTFAPWDGRRVPLTFISGYLGAGKTTAINAVLAETDRPIAVIVNDVGEINIDARLISKQSGDTIELTDGCVCCSLVNGFGAAFDQIRDRETPPDHVVVELSGVADPERVLPWGRSAGFALDGVITMAAADQIMTLTEHPDIGRLVAAQLATADLVAVSKLDAPDAASLEAVREHVMSFNPDGRVIANESRSLAAALVRLGGRRPGGVGDLPTTTLFDHHLVERLPLARPIAVEQVELMLDELGESRPNVMRAKAIFADHDNQYWAVQVVGSRRSITRVPDVEHEPTTDLIVISLP